MSIGSFTSSRDNLQGGERAAFVVGLVGRDHALDPGPKLDVVVVRCEERCPIFPRQLQRALKQRAQTLPPIEPGSSWQNTYGESFNGQLPRELLNTELFTSVAEARWVIEARREEYNMYRPHSSLRSMTPTEFAGRERVDWEPKQTRSRRVVWSRNSHNAWTRFRRLAQGPQRLPKRDHNPPTPRRLQAQKSRCHNTQYNHA